MSTTTDKHARSNYTGTRHKGKRYGTLWYSSTGEDGDVTLSIDFETTDNLLKLDIIDDWIGLLKSERDSIQCEWEAEIADMVASQ